MQFESRQAGRHTHTLTHTRAHTHTHTHSHTHTHTHASTHCFCPYFRAVHNVSCTHTHSHTHTRAHTHAHTHTRKRALFLPLFPRSAQRQLHSAIASPSLRRSYSSSPRPLTMQQQLQQQQQTQQQTQQLRRQQQQVGRGDTDVRWGSGVVAFVQADMHVWLDSEWVGLGM